MIKNFPPFDCIEVVKGPVPEKSSNPFLDYAEVRAKLKEKKPRKTAKEKAAAVARIQESDAGAFESWSPEADSDLRRLFKLGMERDELCNRFGRSQGAILRRLKKLGLV
jgi:hypothetical protein